jgi:hypothetical protein
MTNRQSTWGDHWNTFILNQFYENESPELESDSDAKSTETFTYLNYKSHLSNHRCESSLYVPPYLLVGKKMLQSCPLPSLLVRPKL